MRAGAHANAYGLRLYTYRASRNIDQDTRCYAGGRRTYLAVFADIAA